MIRHIDGIPNLFTDENGHILNEKREVVYALGSHVKIVVYHYGQQRTYDSDWLYLYGRFSYPAYIPVENIRFLEVRNVRKKIGYRALFVRPMMLSDEFRLCASFPKFAVSKSGTVINAGTRTVLEQRLNVYGYPVVGILDPLTDEVRDVVVHRLVAEAWVYKNQTSANPLVNHIDCDKTNNNAGNLEWVTHVSNSRKAVAAGIKPVACPCRLISRDKKEVLNFKTMTDAAAYLGVPVTVLKQAKFTGSKTIQDGSYSVTFYANVKDFCKQAPSGFKWVKVPIEVMNVETGGIELYSSLREINRDLGMCRSLISKLVNSEGSLVFDKWRMRRQSKHDWPTKTTNTSMNRTVKLTEKKTGTCAAFKSLTEASNAVGLCKDSLKRMSKVPLARDKFIVEIR